MDRNCELCEKPLSKLNKFPADICRSCRESDKPTNIWVRFLSEGQVSISSNDDLSDLLDEEPLNVIQAEISRENFALFRDFLATARDDMDSTASSCELLVLDVLPTIVAQAVRNQS